MEPCCCNGTLLLLQGSEGKVTARHGAKRREAAGRRSTCQDQSQSERAEDKKKRHKERRARSRASWRARHPDRGKKRQRHERGVAVLTPAGRLSFLEAAADHAWREQSNAFERVSALRVRARQVWLVRWGDIMRWADLTAGFDARERRTEQDSVKRVVRTLELAGKGELRRKVNVCLDADFYDKDIIDAWVHDKGEDFMPCLYSVREVVAELKMTARTKQWKKTIAKFQPARNQRWVTFQKDRPRAPVPMQDTLEHDEREAPEDAVAWDRRIRQSSQRVTDMLDHDGNDALDTVARLEETQAEIKGKLARYLIWWKRFRTMQQRLNAKIEGGARNPSGTGEGTPWRSQSKAAAAPVVGVGNCAKADRSLHVAFWNQLRSLKAAEHAEAFFKALKPRWKLIGVAGAWNWRRTGIYSHAGTGFVCLWSQGAVSDNGHSVGVGLFVRNPAISSVVDWKAISGRLMWVRFACARKRSVTVVVAYAPTRKGGEDTTQRIQFFRELAQVLNSLPPGDFVVVVGDFNSQTGHDRDGWSGGVVGRFGEQTTVRAPSQTQLVKACLEADMVVANTFFQHGSYATWSAPHHKRVAPTKKCLDYALVQRHQLASVADVKVCTGARWEELSDHCPIEVRLRLKVKLQVKDRAERPGRYDFSVLQGPKEEADEVKSFYAAETKRHLGGRPLSEVTYPELAGALVEAAKTTFPAVERECRPSAKPSDATQQLAKEKLALLKRLNRSKRRWSADDKDEMRELRRRHRAQRQHDLSQYIAGVTEDLKDASMQPMQAEFFRLVRKVGTRGSRDRITAVQTDEGRAVSSPALVADAFRQHFQRVFSISEEVDAETVKALEEIIANVAPVAEPEPPTMEQVREAVKAQKSGKAADEWGAVAAMAKAVLDDDELVGVVHRLVTEAWENGGLSAEMKRGILVPLYKGKGDVKVRDNYRGVTLLPLIRKIYARVVTKPMIEVLEERQPDTQAGGRPGRSTTDNLFILRGLQDQARRKRLPFSAAFLDLRKAYDSVPRALLGLVLRGFGLSKLHVDLVLNLLQDTSCCVRVAGKRSEPFDIFNGVQQGAGESTSFFNAYVWRSLEPVVEQLEELGIEVVFNTKQGKWCRHAELRGTNELRTLCNILFVDDTALLVHKPENLQKAVQLVADQLRRFGMSVNASKSACVNFGGLDAQPCCECGQVSGARDQFLLCDGCDRAFHLQCVGRGCAPVVLQRLRRWAAPGVGVAPASDARGRDHTVEERVQVPGSAHVRRLRAGLGAGCKDGRSEGGVQPPAAGIPSAGCAPARDRRDVAALQRGGGLRAPLRQRRVVPLLRAAKPPPHLHAQAGSADAQGQAALGRRQVRRRPHTSRGDSPSASAASLDRPRLSA